MRKVSSLKNLRRRVEGLQIVRRGKRLYLLTPQGVKKKYKATQ